MKRFFNFLFPVNMMLCPLENSAVFTTDWVQKKPVITQRFGERPEYYSKYKMKGHNGADFRAKTPLPVFAPINGEMTVEDDKDKGYGLHIVIRSAEQELEVTLAHLSSVSRWSGFVKMGDFLGLTGNSGDSSAPHLHITPRRLIRRDNLKVWAWEVKDRNNGYLGAFDPLPYMICWKGGIYLSTFA